MEDNSSNSTHLSLSFTAASPTWVKPNDVMKTRKLKARRNALKARFVSLSPIQSKFAKNGNSPVSSNFSKKNPFKCLQTKEGNLHSQNTFLENSNDCSLFNLIVTQSESKKSKCEEPYSFSKILADTQDKNVQEKPFVIYADSLAVDWSLKSRIRFLSTKPMQWKHTFKTSEEASGTTGFVRCLNSETEMRDGRTLDTSANAQFYQCCLIWQHPNIPLVTLFPREKQKLSGPIGIYGSDQKITKSLHSEWGDSLRSLYQLLRVRQCPFFYVCGHSFTCLFRATGAAGLSQTHALITPTTRGFRDALKTEGVEFSMPLLEKNQSGEIIDELDETDNLSEEVDNSEETTEFLETLGLEASQFPSLNQSRVKTEDKKFQSIDGSPQSLVFVEDMDLHGLVNFILNCGSCVTTTGTLAGVPPTLLSPVAFHGGCLKSLKVNGSTIRLANGETEFCVDIQGPILPTAVLHLSSLLASSQESFSASLTPINSNLPFCYVSPSNIGTSMPLAFASEGLVDCGLGKEVREVLCKDNNDCSSELPPTYRHINFDNGRYTWSDKL